MPLSIPAKHFEHFERFIQQINDSSVPSIDDCIITSVMSSSNVSQRASSNSNGRSQLPSLINVSVQDFNDSRMDIDSDTEMASRKRALLSSNTENQGGIKFKKPASDVSTNSRDSLVDSDSKLKLYTQTPTALLT